MTTTTTTTTTTASTETKSSPPRRLLIQAVVVLQMLFLTACAIWWGLCVQNDVMCIPLFQLLHQQSPISSSTLLLADIPASLLNLNSSVNSKQQRFYATLTLQLEDDGSLTWSKWSSALQTWIQESGFDNWPLWKSPPHSNVLVGGPLTDKSKFRSTTNVTTVSMKALEESMAPAASSSLTRRWKKEDTLEIVLYVPKTAPFVAVDRNGQQSTAVVMNENRLVSIVQDLTLAEEAVKESMSYLMTFLEKHGVSQDLEKWMEGTALSYLHQAQMEMLSVQASLLLLQSSDNADVAITSHVAERWLQAVHSAEEGLKQANLKQWQLSMELLEACLALLESIRSDPSLMPPLHLQIDHCLAIFAPLLFPLLLPMIAGLVREYKRYKKSKLSE